MIKKFCLLFCLFSLSSSLSGCAEADQDFHRLMFPEASFDEFKAEWYGSNLRALQEPPLYGDLRSLRVVRFSWLPTWHPAVAIRIEESALGEFRLYSAIADGSAGYDPGKLAEASSRMLSIDEEEMVRPVFEQLALCEPPPQEIGFDGSQWVFEYASADRYCAVDQWTPREGKWFQIGLSLVAVAGLNLDIY